MYAYVAVRIFTFYNLRLPALPQPLSTIRLKVVAINNLRIFKNELDKMASFSVKFVAGQNGTT